MWRGTSGIARAHASMMRATIINFDHRPRFRHELSFAARYVQTDADRQSRKLRNDLRLKTGQVEDSELVLLYHGTTHDDGT